LFVDDREEEDHEDIDDTNEYLNFFINPNYPPLFYTIEVYGDFIPIGEEKEKEKTESTPTAFDQLLLSVILTPDQIPRDGKSMWVTVSNVTYSLFNQQSVDLLIKGQSTAITHEELDQQASPTATPDQSNRQSWMSDGSPSSTRLSWSQRFSSVFTRKSMPRESIETARSTTPPPPPLLNSNVLPSPPSDQLRSPMELYLKQVEEFAFSDSEEDDTSTVRSESTTATTRSRSVCGVGDTMTTLDMLKIDNTPLEEDGLGGNDERGEELLMSLSYEEQSSDVPFERKNLNQRERRRGDDEGSGGGIGVDDIAHLKRHPLEMESCHQMTQISHKLFETFSSSEYGLGIYCSTPCAHCGGCYLDEEILSSWCGLLTERLSNSISPNCGDVLRLHHIPCILCKELLIPTLHIRRYRVPSLSSSRDEDDLKSLETVWQYDVPYLSPLGVRAMTESLIREHGPIVANANWLLKMAPIVFWNQIWYTSRLNLPSGLFQDLLTRDEKNQLWQGPVAIGWRESTIKAKIFKLCHHHSPHLTLKDLFPSLTDEDKQVVETLMTNFDHSIPAIAMVLKKLSTLSSILESFMGNTSKGRQLYLAYLFLSFHFYPHSISKASDLPYGLSKVCSSPFSLLSFALSPSLSTPL
jgi:hypothetical protein